MHLSIRWVSKKSIIIFKYVLGETKKKKRVFQFCALKRNLLNMESVLDPPFNFIATWCVTEVIAKCCKP